MEGKQMSLQRKFSTAGGVTSNEVDCSLTHAIGLVDSISYVASRSKKSSKLGLKMALYAGAVWAVYYYLDVNGCNPNNCPRRKDSLWVSIPSTISNLLDKINAIVTFFSTYETPVFADQMAYH